jgi:hypothetical protein
LTLRHPESIDEYELGRKPWLPSLSDTLNAT